MQKSLHIHITKKGFIILAMVLTAIIGVAAPFSVNASLVREDTRDAFIAPGPSVIIYANPESSDLYIPRRMSPLHDQAVTATINVNYIGGGWTTEAQTAFQYAADIWETLITSPVTIEVDVEYKDLSYLGAGILGAAGPTTVLRDFTNAPVSGTWYPQAVANKLAGTDLDPSYADIAAAFNSAQPDWYFGTGMTTPVNKYSFVTVALHELGHGLGFLGSMDVDGGVGSYGIDGYPFIYDTYTENNAGTPLVNFTNPSPELSTQLQSGNVFFDAPYANYANSGTRVELYAPGTWQPGSSYSHLDEWANSTPHALMTYSVNLGETVHDPGAVVLCMFKDMGWTVSQQCSDSGYKIYLPLILKNYSGGGELPDVPALISPSNGSTTANTTPTFSWSTSSGATQYQIQIDNNADFSSPEEDQTRTVMDYTPALALSNGTYNWRVRAGDGSNWSLWSSVWTVTIGPAVPLLTGDFESGPVNWTEYSYNGWLLILQESAMPVDAHSGIWAVWLGGGDDEISYIEQTVTVPPTSPHFTYWHWIESEDTCGYDYGGVLVNGSTVVDVYDLCSAENTSGWVLHSVDLSAYAWQTIPVQIRVETDVALISNLYVDDVSFESSPAPPLFIARSGSKVFTGPKSNYLLKKSGDDIVQTPRVFRP